MTGKPCERRVDLVVSLPENSRQRLDLYLAQEMPDFTRARIQKLIETGHVDVAGKPAKPGLKLRGGETLSVRVPADEELALAAEDIPIAVVFEDDELIVINKPAGMVTHPGAGIQEGTLVNALLHHCKGSLSGISGTARPGIVHRLDKDTSGLMVVAKSDRAHKSLSEQISKKEAQRVYIALLEGLLPIDEGTVDKPIGRHPTLRKQMSVNEKGRRAVSHFQVLSRFHAYTLVRVALETGRTHQIRVHMASLGYPVVADIVYNHKKTGSLARRHKLGLTGQALHAARLIFRHPLSGHLLEFEAPLPADFQRLVDSLSEA